MLLKSLLWLLLIMGQGFMLCLGYACTQDCVTWESGCYVAKVLSADREPLDVVSRTACWS